MQSKRRAATGRGDAWLEFTQDQVNDLLKHKQDEGWDVQFLGSGGSAWLEATFGHAIGLDKIGTFDHDSDATGQHYSAMSREISAVRRSGKKMERWTDK